MTFETQEIPNPYLLYTFNLERINDYYSLDPARHASAVKWLEEWLETNEPYESIRRSWKQTRSKFCPP